MSTPHSKGIPKWFWGASILATAITVCILLAKDQWKEPSPALKYDTARLLKTDDSHVLFREVAQLACGIPKPIALAVAQDKSFYVAGEKSLLLLDSSGKELKRLTLNESPNAIAVTPEGLLILAMRDHIEIATPDGNVQKKSESLGERAFLKGVVVNTDSIYASDAGNRVLLRFDREAKLVNRLGQEDASKDIPGFMVPSAHFDIALDPDGGLWAVNPGKHGLENYRPDGTLVTSWYRPGMELDSFSGCCNPTDIAFRPDGSLITAEKGIIRVKLYAADWRCLGLVAGPETFEESYAKAAPGADETAIMDLAVDSDGRVLVLDAGLSAVRVFEQKRTPS